MSPTRPTAHDHAFSVETLAEKAARLRREQGLPAKDEPHHCPPRPCYWHEDQDGSRFLIPACMARVINPDIDECTCPTVEQQLTTVREELAQLRRERNGLQHWHDQIVRAVYDHRDGIEIMRTAVEKAQRTGSQR